MSNSTITKTIFLNTDAETVWAYLTDKDNLAEWFYGADASLAKGKEYVLSGKADDGTMAKKCWGKVVEARKPRKLVYSFTIAPLGGNMTTVTWLLEDALGGTRLTLQHEGLGDAVGDAGLPLMMGLDAGWDGHLGKLRAALKR